MTAADLSPFDALDLDVLRARQSAKWRVYPEDVLPAWVAEMDFPVADPIRAALHASIDANDCGYAFSGGLPEDFADWARATWGWVVAPGDVFLVPDVVTGLEALLRVVTEPGDGVVIDPPVYPPFAGTLRATGRKVVTTPLARVGEGFAMDLDAVAKAYAAGAKAHVLCSPHNPSGIVLAKETLIALGDLAAKYGVVVLSDEIHAPLTLPGATHHPFASVSEAARETSVVLTSSSKTWNLAGLKAALLVGQGAVGRKALSRLPAEMPYHAGHFGVLASRAAFRHGEGWRRAVLSVLDRNRRTLSARLAESLPEVRYVPQAAGYLAWLDFRATDLGDDPSRVLLEKGRVALSAGPSFGSEGRGFARLNVATSAGLLEEAVRRIVLAVRSPK
ncbi:MAG: aminotransferase class I/II-fold pyridoxal phosphate-dependent enzyme [Polyangiaceae bacterium]